jgi:hypothetical protein
LRAVNVGSQTFEGDRMGLVISYTVGLMSGWSGSRALGESGRGLWSGCSSSETSCKRNMVAEARGGLECKGKLLIYGGGLSLGEI